MYLNQIGMYTCFLHYVYMGIWLSTCLPNLYFTVSQAFNFYYIFHFWAGSLDQLCCFYQPVVGLNSDRYVYMCMCMYVCTYICMHIYVYACACAHTYHMYAIWIKWNVRFMHVCKSFVLLRIK